jgi:hypothetical protein
VRSRIGSGTTSWASFVCASVSSIGTISIDGRATPRIDDRVDRAMREAGDGA